MLGKIKRFFDDAIAPDVGGRSGASQEHALQLATAALFLEMMAQDDVSHQAEQQTIRRSLQNKFSLSDDELSRLLLLADEERKQATDFHQFTSLIHQQFDYEQKVRVIELMWNIAFADGTLDPYEDNLVRKVADLLYIKHADFVAARDRAEADRC